MNTLLQMFGLTSIEELTKVQRNVEELKAERTQHITEIDHLKKNSQEFFAHNQSLTAENKKLKAETASLNETIKNLNDKLDKKNYFANIRKMGNMKQQIARLTAKLNKYENQ